MELIANKISIDMLIQGQQCFSIPVYQRNYDWGTDQCAQLYDDMLRVMQTTKPHFLGTIVYKPERDLSLTYQQYVIIDGQQRITSLMLFIKAIVDVYKDDSCAQIFNDQFLRITTFCTKGQYKIKLKPITKDAGVYNKLIEDMDTTHKILTPEEKETNIYQNYSFFVNKLKTIKEKGYTPGELFTMLRNLIVVKIELDEENPQEIFESLNSTGLDLTQTDLLRNYLLMSLKYEEQETLYNTYWVPMENLLKDTVNVQKFMFAYLLMKRKSQSIIFNTRKKQLSEKNLYTFWKLFFKDNRDYESTLNRLKDMLRFANHYHRLLETTRPKDYIGKKLYEITQELDCMDASPALIYLLDLYHIDKISEEQLGTALNICSSLVARRKICGLKVNDTQFYTLLIPKLDLVNFNEPDWEDQLWNAFCYGSGISKFPSNGELKKAIEETDFYPKNKSLCRYMLNKIEKKYSKEVPSDEDATIEHIMPQTLNDDWKDDLVLNHEPNMDNLNFYIHKIGNLTLTKENSKLSNHIFKEKQSEYRKSNYSYTRDLESYSKWTTSEIVKRTRRLAETAIKVWPLLDKYNYEQKANDFYNFTDDFYIFTGTKPLYIKINNNDKIYVSSWNEFVQQLIAILYTLNSDIMRDLVNSDSAYNIKRLISDTNEDYEKYHKLSTFYVNERTGKSTLDILNLCKFIIQYYEQHGGYTDLSTNITFGIRN